MEDRRTFRLSQQEREILGEVELDAQRSSQEVAKALGIRDFTVQHVLRRMRSRGVISLKPFIDISRLGRGDVAVYFSLALTQQRVLGSFLNQVRSSPDVAFLQSLAGDYHFIVVLHCRRINDVHTFLKLLSMWSNGTVVRKAVIPRTRYVHYRRKYLTKPRRSEPSLVALDAPDEIELTKEEALLLECLSQPEHSSIRDTARTLKLPYSTIDYRYQQLVKKGVIRGWFYDIDEHYLGAQRVKLLVSCVLRTSEFDLNVERFTLKHPNVTYLLETLGEWDLEIGVECPNAEDVMNVIAQLHESFPREIGSIRSVTELKTFKFTMFPGV